MVDLTEYDLTRYDRQIRLFGIKGQENLKRSKVFIAGVGGLGSPVAIYLAEAGIGKIRIVDKDKIELSNLNRQILHWDKDIGKKKCDSAYEKLRQINSHITIESFCEIITDRNVSHLIDESQVIVDCLDNFPTRYILNAFACKRNIPYVHAAVHGMEARVTTIIPGDTPCLRCIFPQAPEPEIFPVLGATPGLSATIQVMEVIKLLTGTGRLLKNKLLIFDGVEGKFNEVRVERSPSCPDCGSL